MAVDPDDWSADPGMVRPVFACDMCGFSCRAAGRSSYGVGDSYLGRHCASHLRVVKRRARKRRRRLVCDACDQEFSRVVNLARHLAHIHGFRGIQRDCERSGGRCDWCQCECLKDNICQHMRVCAYFPNSAAFGRIHVQKQYRHKLVSCDDCGFKSRSDRIIRHWRRRHSNRPAPHSFFCDTCDYGCKERCEIKSHLCRRRCW
jgi:hypothetical protein